MKIDVKSGDRRIRACALAEKHADEIKAAFAEGLNALNEALDAERVVLDREGEPLNLGPDFAMRTASTRLLNELCLRCRKAPVEEQEKAPPWTMEALTEALRNYEPEALASSDADVNKQFRNGKLKDPKSGGWK